jgi:hypothetical protein
MKLHAASCAVSKEYIPFPPLGVNEIASIRPLPAMKERDALDPLL